MRVVAALAVALGLTAGPAPVAAAPAPSPSPSPAGLFVELTPSTVEAGAVAGIRASCSNGNTEPATVESRAFGDVEVQPQDGFLTAVATVPEDQREGSYRVRLDCPNGRFASATLYVLNDTRPSRGPATGFGGTAGGGPGAPTLLIGGGLLAIAAGLALGLVTVRRRRTP